MQETHSSGRADDAETFGEVEESQQNKAAEGCAGLPPPGWRGTVSRLGGEALKALWVDVLGYAKWEIRQYGRWRDRDEPVLASGFDAESIVQSGFEKLFAAESAGVSGMESAEEIRHRLRSHIKHRIRWLHERSETRVTVSEWDLVRTKDGGELASIFDCLPGRNARPDEEVMSKEKLALLKQFKSSFEAGLGKRKQLRRVFGRIWNGEKRRRVAKALGLSAERIKAVQAQLKRRVRKFAAAARGGMAEALREI